MTKKHFIKLAEYLTDAMLDGYCKVPGVNHINPDLLRSHLANFCHSVNPKFDRERWLAYIKQGGEL